MKKIITLMVMSILLAVACTNPDSGNSQNTPPINNSTEFVFCDNVVVFDNSNSSQIKVVDKTIININNDIDGVQTPKVGDIIYCMNSEKQPYGFIGRVVSLTDCGTYTTYITEEVLLTDIFEELHINTTVELPKDIPYFMDSEGNKYESSSVENDVWDTINDDNKDDNTNNPASRASANLTGSHTAKIAISNSGAFSGHLYINSLLSLRIDISKGKLDEFSYEYNKRCGIVGGLSLSADKGRDFVLVNKTIMLPFSIAVGPLLLTTDFNIKCGLNCSAETKVEGGLNFEFDNSTAKFSYNNGSPTYEVLHADVSQNKHLVLTRFETTVGVGLYFDSAMEMACYHRNILAVGAGVKGEYNISVNNEIAYSNTELLKINPCVTITPEVEAGVFCRSKLFKWSGDEEEFGIYRSFVFASFELPIFPEFYNFVTETANNKIKATAELIKKNYIKTTEEGFALFKRDSDTALEHKKISPSTRNGESSISFDVENSNDYVVKPYTVSDGIYFYGEEYRRRRITAIQVEFSYGYNIKYDLMYNEDGFLQAITAPYDGEYTTSWSYSNDSVTITESDASFSSTTNCTLGANGCLLSYKNDWSSASFDYDDIGYLSASCFSGGEAYSCSWDKGNLTKITCLGNYVLTCDYNDVHNLANIDLNWFVVEVTTEAESYTDAIGPGMTLSTVALASQGFIGCTNANFLTRISGLDEDYTFNWQYDDKWYPISCRLNWSEGYCDVKFEYE